MRGAGAATRAAPTMVSTGFRGVGFVSPAIASGATTRARRGAFPGVADAPRRAEPERAPAPGPDCSAVGAAGRRGCGAVRGGGFRLSVPGVEERALAAVPPLPAGFNPARAEARVAGTNAFFSVVAAFLLAGFRLIGLAAASPFVAGFAAVDPFVAGFTALAFFSGFFGFVGFVGFFAAVAVLAAVRPAREGAAVVRRDAALPFFAAETALVLRLSLAAFFFVTRFDLPAMVSLSLRLCRRARANSARLGSIFALVVFGQSHFFAADQRRRPDQARRRQCWKTP